MPGAEGRRVIDTSGAGATTVSVFSTLQPAAKSNAKLKAAVQNLRPFIIMSDSSLAGPERKSLFTDLRFSSTSTTILP
jgi:hypothetical protein